MRKSTLFISGVLTMFMLVMVYGLVAGYQGSVNVEQPAGAIQTELRADLQSARLISLAPTPGGIVTPEQATSIAVQMIDRTDVYSVESTEYESAAAYLVTFTSGDLVYVSPSGQILAVTKLEPVVVVQSSHRNNDDSSQGGESEHEEHGEREEHEEHEGGDDD